MAQSYLLFFSECDEPTARRLLKQWFPELGEGESTGYIHKGPDDKPGAIVSYLDTPQEFYPTQNCIPTQTWEAFPKHDAIERPANKVFLGTESEVTPETLARKNQFRGNLVVLADGNAWQVPSANDLPHKYTAGENGQHARAVDPRFQKWHDKAFEIMANIFKALGMWDEAKNAISVPETTELSDEIKTIPVTDCIDFVSEALSMNYRLNREIALMLGLLDERANQRIVASTFDMAEIIEVINDPQKKTEDLVSIPVSSNS